MGDDCVLLNSAHYVLVFSIITVSCGTVEFLNVLQICSSEALHQEIWTVDQKFLRNMRFAKKHNKKGVKTIARKAAAAAK
ncbi:unnamed protein product [Leuciscus chuanchicus]